MESSGDVSSSPQQAKKGLIAAAVRITMLLTLGQSQPSASLPAGRPLQQPLSSSEQAAWSAAGPAVAQYRRKVGLLGGTSCIAPRPSADIAMSWLAATQSRSFVSRSISDCTSSAAVGRSTGFWRMHLKAVRGGRKRISSTQGSLGHLHACVWRAGTS